MTTSSTLSILALAIHTVLVVTNFVTEQVSAYDLSQLDNHQPSQ